MRPTSTSPNGRYEYDGPIRRRSGWLIPLAVFAVTSVLSIFVLLYYLFPAPASFIEEHPAPTARTDPTSLTVGAVRLAIPANYVLYRSAREGGMRNAVALFALLPDLRGYSDDSAQAFASNAADSRVVYLLIREEPIDLDESERLARIYLSFVSDPAGKPGPFGLTVYSFRNDSGYRGEDLFVGNTAGGTVVMRCVRFSAQVPSPSCLRDIRLKRNVALSYRFKRSHLDAWRDIASGVAALVQSFRVHAR
jgi:hypothetical protein